MKPLTREWAEKAEGDYASAQRELRARKNPNYDAACFHAPQCVEKYLKARLQERDLRFPRTHDLVVPAGLLREVEPLWQPLEPELRLLTVFAVETRYPGASADRETAREALSACRKLRTVIRDSLDIAGPPATRARRTPPRRQTRNRKRSK
jgi:HEPN domain-containing protein